MTESSKKKRTDDIEYHDAEQSKHNMRVYSKRESQHKKSHRETQNNKRNKRRAQGDREEGDGLERGTV